MDEGRGLGGVLCVQVRDGHGDGDPELEAESRRLMGYGMRWMRAS